jgi:hypothetical protein
VRNFDQISPIALTVDAAGVSVRMYAGTRPLELKRGVTKTAQIYSSPCSASESGEAQAKAFLHPLIVTTPYGWYQASNVSGSLATR